MKSTAKNRRLPPQGASRKRKPAELEATLAAYAEVIRDMPVGFYIWHFRDPKDPGSLALVAANRAALQLGGWAGPGTDQLPSVVPFADYLKSKFSAALVETAISGQNKDLGEVRYGDAHQTETIFWVRALPLIGGGGVGAIFEDVILRKQAERHQIEETLRRTEKEFRFILDSVSDCVWSGELDQSGKLTYRYVSGVVGSITGRKPDFFLSHPDPWIQIVHPEDRPRILESFARITQGQSLREEEEYRIVWPDGSVRWVRGSVKIHRVDGGGVLRLNGIVSDITSRKEVEATLRESEERWRSIATNAPDYILSVDESGKILSLNRAAPGFTIDQVLGTSLYEYVVPDHHPIVRRQIARIFETGEPSSHEILGIGPNGAFVSYMSRGGPIKRDGKVAAAIIIASDITEKKRLEENLRQSQKMEALGRLAGGVAHDFNNLLLAIMGYSELLMERFPPQDQSRKEIDEIWKAGKRAASLTRQLLAFSRRQVLQSKALDLNTEVTDMDKMLRRLIGEDIELITSTDPSPGRVRADPGQVEQVILNLTLNARDAMPHGGKLTIRTANVDFTADSLHERGEIPPGSYVLLSVSDTGCGMDEHIRDHIFEPFFTTKEQGKGTGLGLATVYGNVTQSGGHLRVISRPNEGSTFEIYFPRIGDSDDESFEKSGKSTGFQGTETILLVEDEIMVRSFIREILRKRHYTVLESSNGADALALCKEYRQPIHLLLTDIVMPKMNGCQLAKRLSQSRPEMKIIFMSGYTDDLTMRDELLDRSAPFLQKPFAVEDLVSMVRNALENVRTSHD